MQLLRSSTAIREMKASIQHRTSAELLNSAKPTKTTSMSSCFGCLITDNPEDSTIIATAKKEMER